MWIIQALFQQPGKYNHDKKNEKKKKDKFILLEITLEISSQ